MCHLLSEVSPSSPFMGLFSPPQSYACSTLLKTAGLAQGMGETGPYLDAQPFPASCLIRAVFHQWL